MAFTYKLVLEDGSPADPLTLRTAVPKSERWRHNPAWRPDGVFCRAFATTTTDQAPVLVVERRRAALGGALSR
jgi:hypothetical protein